MSRYKDTDAAFCKKIALDISRRRAGVVSARAIKDYPGASGDTTFLADCDAQRAWGGKHARKRQHIQLYFTQKGTSAGVMKKSGHRRQS